MAKAIKKIKPPQERVKQISIPKSELMERLNTMENSMTCCMCGAFKVKSEFYTSYNPLCQSGYAPICKSCAEKIANRVDIYGNELGLTKKSLIQALLYIDKPYIASVYEQSKEECKNKNHKYSLWSTYVRKIYSLNHQKQYFIDSDFFKFSNDIINDVNDLKEKHKGQDNYDSFLKNKNDVIRLLDYDPFEKELLEDQPFLYSNLLGMIDLNEDNNMDIMRVSSAITIVRSFLQESKLDDTITKLMADSLNISNNSNTIRILQESKQKLTSLITSLAAENCLSLKNSKTVTKGENTWTGKLKKLHELNLREAQNNGFDVATCRGMQQVQEISDASIMKQLKLDESEWSDMVAEMRVTNSALRKERDKYKEINRILLKENIDLKDKIKEDGLKIDMNLIDLKEVYSVFKDDD